jgi:hypothetical protein
LVAFFAGDLKFRIGKIRDMKALSRIHQGKQPNRRHFINEWLQARDMDPMDLLNKLNEADTSLPYVEKSQVYRWLKGQLPQLPMQIRIAGALEIVDIETGEPDPDGLMRHPDLDWFARKLQHSDEEDIKRLKAIVELTLQPRTGTRN